MEITEHVDLSQAGDSDLAAIAALSTTNYGRNLLTLADAPAGRTALALGTAATHAHGDYDTAGAAAAAQAASQPVDSDLTAIAALTTTAFGRDLLTKADAAAIRSYIGAISDTAYAGSWDGVADVAPSKNAVYDKIQALSGASQPSAQHFYVDTYLPGTPTAAQTTVAAQAAQDAAEAVGGVCKFTPGKTYTMDGTVSFKLGSGVTLDITGATLKKGAGTNIPLLTNKDWAAGNPGIKIISHGATIDFDKASQAGGGGSLAIGNCVWLQNITRLQWQGRPLVKRSLKFAALVGHGDDIDLDGFDFDTGSDGLHFYGPINHMRVGRCSGTTGDDMVSFTISDYPTQIAALAAGGETVLLGDFNDIHVESIDMTNDVIGAGGSDYGSGLAVLGNSGTYKVRRLHVGQITGATHHTGCRIGVDATLTNLQVEDITIDKIAVTNGALSTVVVLNPTVADSITIGEFVNDDTGAVTPIQVLGGHIKALNIGGYTQLGSGTTYLLNVVAAAIVDHLHLRNVNVLLGANGRLVQHSSTTAMHVTLDDYTVAGTAGTGWLLYHDAGAGVLTLNLGKGRLSTLSKVFNLAASNLARVLIDGAVFDTNTSLASIGATSLLRIICGPTAQLAAGDLVVSKTAGGIFTATGLAYRVDLSKIDTASATAGDTVYNTNAAADPGVGLVIYDGTSWRLIPEATVADWTLPTGVIAHTAPRTTPVANVGVLSTQRLTLSAIRLRAGQVVSKIRFFAATTPLSAGAHQWFALFDSARAKLAVTADDTVTAWSANTTKTLFVARTVTDAAITSGQPTLTSATAAFTAADTGREVIVIGAGAAGVPLGSSAVPVTMIYVNATTVTLSANAGTTVSGAIAYIATPYTATTTGLYYGGINVDGTVPTLFGSVVTGSVISEVPALTGTSSTGLTDPSTCPNPAAVISASASFPRVEVL